MHAAAIQLPVTMDVRANLLDLKTAIMALPRGSIAVAPEGCLSGYLPRAGFVAELDGAETAAAVDQAREMAARAGVHLVAGACIQADGAWRNASFYMSPEGELWRYDKINLAQSERIDFTPGNSLPVVDILVDRAPVRLGVQMCREIRYPEQWRYLAIQGAQVIAYVNNAIASTRGHEVWRAHVISRAAENQRFVIAANNAAPDQLCSSLIVSPAGEVLAEAAIGETATVQARIDLAEVSDWVIGQGRSDVVAISGV
jgi:predicted amidohydrolase